MAEADEEDPSKFKFYCHECKERFATVLPNFTCPRCSAGFIDEVEVKPETKQDAPVPEDDNDEEVRNILLHGDFHDHGLQPDAFEMRGGNDRNGSSNTELNRRRSGIIRPRIRRQRIIRVTAALYGVTSGNLVQEMDFEFPAPPDLIAGSGNMETLLGAEELNTIFTQLTNRMSNTEPSPVSKEVVDTLQIVEVTPEDVSTQLKCSICLETYVLGELVRQLLCGHKYHDACIRRWLLIQAKCPMCRKHITENETIADGLSTLDSIIWEWDGSNNSSSSTVTRDSDSPTSNNTSSSNRDSKM